MNSYTWIKKSDWLEIRSGRGIIIYSASQGLNVFTWSAKLYTRKLAEVYWLYFWTFSFGKANKKTDCVGFNDTSTSLGHFVSSPREREKRERRDSRGDERETGERGK